MKRQAEYGVGTRTFLARVARRTACFDVPPLIEVFALAALYFLMARLGLLMAIPGGHVTPVWPPSGIALAAVLLRGRRIWPGIWLGSFAANVLDFYGGPRGHATELAMSATFGISASLTAVLGGQLLRRFVGERNPLERVRDVCAFMALGGVVSCLSSATIGVTALCLTSFAPWSAYGQTWLTWWLGDTAGVFIVAPLFLVWGGTRRWMSVARWVELFVGFGLLIAVTYYVFVVNTTVLFTGKPLTFVLIPFLVWLAVRFGRRGAATAAGLIALLAVWGTIRGSGPFNLGSRNESLLALELFLSVISLSALSIAVVVTERRQAEGERRRMFDELESRVAERTRSLHQANAALRESEARFTAFMDHLPGLAWMKDLEGRYTYANDTLSKLGPFRAAWLGKTDVDLWPSKVAASYRVNDEAVIATGKPLQTVESYFLDGKASHVLVSKFPILDVTGAVVMVGGAGIDITERKAAEEKLSQSLALLRAITEGSTDAIYAKDRKGRYLVFNTAAARFVGKSTKEVIGLDDTQLFSDETLAGITERDRHILESGETRTDEETTTTASGNFRIYLTTKGPLRDSLGAITGLFGVSRDITERKQAEEALAAQVLRYKTLMETSMDSIYVMDEKGDLQEANAAFLRRRGYTAAEAKGLNVADWDARHSREQLQERMRRLAGSSAVFETRHRCKDGSIFDVEVCATSVRIGGKSLFFVVTRDITERKEVEGRLRRSEEKFKALFGIAPVGISVLDRQHNIVDANPALERIMRLSREDLLGGAYRRRTYLNANGTVRPRNELPSERAVAQSRPINDVEVGIVIENGEIIWTQVSVAPLALPEASAVVITQDITERKQAEQELRESEARTRLLVKSSNVGLWDWNLLTNEVFYSPKWKSQLGYEDDEVPGRHEEWEKRLHPQDRGLCLRAVKDFREGRIGDFETEFRLRHKDGSWRSMLSRADLIRGAAGQPLRMMGCHIDITERKIAEAALRESEERFRELAENINEVFWIWTAPPGNARCLYVSPAYATIWGRSCESLYSSPRSWMEALHPQDRERIMEEGARMDFETITDWTYRIVRTDHSIRWIRDRIFPVRDVRGAVVRFAGIAQDITESKEAEEQVRKANRQLRTLSRRRIQEQEDERRRLSRELHDQIGQSLTAAKINVEALRVTENRALVGRIDETSALLDELLGQVRQISLDLRPPMLDDLGLVPALRSFIHEQGRRASIAVRFSSERVPEKLDAEIAITCFRIAQEAITNAVRHAKASQLEIALRCARGKTLRLLARDNGIGFDAKLRQAQAVDLGLIGIRERAALVGGRVKIISSPRKGTTIDVSLPLTFRGERQARQM